MVNLCAIGDESLGVGLFCPSGWNLFISTNCIWTFIIAGCVWGLLVSAGVYLLRNKSWVTRSISVFIALFITSAAAPLVFDVFEMRMCPKVCVMPDLPGGTVELPHGHN
jgi:hypothetical protein